jgi:5-methylcytosine-specific restriction protein A
MPKLPPRKEYKQTGQYSKGRVGNFYSSPAWIRTRNAKIREQPLCVECLKMDILQGWVKGQSVIDHIKPIQDGGEPFDMDNLQHLCKQHHAIKTGRETAKRK